MYWYEYCPKHIESKYKLLVFKENQPFLPLSDYFNDCLGRIDKSSATSYLNCLLPFFKWLEEESNFQGERVQWNDEEEKIRVVVEDYLMHKMNCKIRDQDSFNKSPNTISRFLSALKSFYKAIIRLNQYPYNNPLFESQAILNQLKEELKGVRVDKPRMPSVAGTEEPLQPHFAFILVRLISCSGFLSIQNTTYGNSDNKFGISSISPFFEATNTSARFPFPQSFFLELVLLSTPHYTQLTKLN
ncbi:hypothetical protein ABH966_005456 [Lysinibacillus sp. RC46]|uniref:hypothetical protein n=2 Tax=Lysinibacillus TaxID=400634 RepID=UPI003510EE40